MDTNIDLFNNLTASKDDDYGVTTGTELKYGILKICLFSTFFVLGLIVLKIFSPLATFFLDLH